MKKIVFAFVLLGLAVNVFAVNYCRDCDRGIADGKEYCNKCDKIRQKNSLTGAMMLLKMVDNAGKAAKKAEQKRRAEADRKAKAEVARMDRIINTSVNWTADSKTKNRKYYFAFVRENDTPLYGYIGDNYTKVDLNRRRFEAKALYDSPTIPKGTSGGNFKIIIMDDLSRWFVLTKVELTYHNAKTMTIHITELSYDKIRVQVWTGHWHKRNEEVHIICDKILNAHPNKKYHYAVPIVDEINYDITKQDVINTIQDFWKSKGDIKYIYPEKRNAISFPGKKWSAHPFPKTGASFYSVKNIKINSRNNTATATGITGGFEDDYEFGLVKLNGTVYIVGIVCDNKVFNFEKGKFE